MKLIKGKKLSQTLVFLLFIVVYCHQSAADDQSVPAPDRSEGQIISLDWTEESLLETFDLEWNLKLFRDPHSAAVQLVNNIRKIDAQPFESNLIPELRLLNVVSYYTDIFYQKRFRSDHYQDFELSPHPLKTQIFEHYNQNINPGTQIYGSVGLAYKIKPFSVEIVKLLISNIDTRSIFILDQLLSYSTRYWGDILIESLKWESGIPSHSLTPVLSILFKHLRRSSNYCLISYYTNMISNILSRKQFEPKMNTELVLIEIFQGISKYAPLEVALEFEPSNLPRYFKKDLEKINCYTSYVKIWRQFQVEKMSPFKLACSQLF